MRVPSFHAFRSGRVSVAPPAPAALANLWSWGGNNVGQLGLGNLTNRSSPVQVGTLTNWAEVFGGTRCSFATKTDGTLWAWGQAVIGKLGLPDAYVDRSSPVQVGALTDWTGAKISSREVYTLAVKSNGTLWAWGNNFFGTLGLGHNTRRSSPVQVGALTNWAEVSVGQAAVLAVKTDGTLWSWGYNSVKGVLGLGDTINRSSPVQVGTLTSWSKVAAVPSASLAIKTDGTLWSWGGNNTGQLGLGNTTSRSSPVQVGVLTNWSKIAGAGAMDSYYAVYRGLFSSIKTDGTLWSWGYNSKGHLGLGDTINRSSPVQVGVLTDWSKLSVNSDSFYCFNHNTALIKTNGTLWAWGANIDGEHANGVTSVVRRSAPVQLLSGISDWNSVSVIAGSYNGGAMLALRTA